MDNIVINTNNFTGMDEGNVYYLDGMSPQKVSGKTILNSSWGNTFLLSASTSGFSAYDGSNSMCFLKYSATLGDHIVSIGTDHIFDIGFTGTTALGLIHTIPTTGSSTDEIKPSTSPELFVTTSNYILYALSHHLGIAYKFTATSATSTSLVVSGATLNATYGISDAAGRNKIYNLTKQEEYTNTTAAPTTTLAFSAATTTPEAGDEFLVFMDNKFKFNISHKISNHFSNQDYPTNWNRQIKLLGDDYWILNGNYLASLNIDGTTFSETAKRLPYNTNAACFDENNGMLLVGGDILGAGKLMLWDTFSEGWLSILSIEKSPSAIKAYKNGWLVFIGSTIYFTDGYQVQELTRCPDLLSYGSNLNVHYNGVEIVENNIIINSGANLSNRARTGIYIYDVKNGWSYTPHSINASDDKLLKGSAGIAYLFGNQDGSYNVYTSGYEAGVATTNYVIGKLGTTSSNDCSTILAYDLPRKMRINTVDLRLGIRYNSRSPILTDTSVTLNYGDGTRTLWFEASSAASSTTTLINNADGVTKSGYAGQEIRFLNGATAGERSYIVSVANTGEATEAWTISPALSTTPDVSSTVVCSNLYKSETKTISDGKIPSNLTFNISDFFADKLYLEIVFNGNINIDILGVNIY